MSTSATRPDRTLTVVLSIIGALVLVSLIVVFSRGEPQLRDASTPEGVVQRYAAALIEGDDDAARQYVAEDSLKPCDEFGRADPGDVRVTLVSTTVREGSADVRVSIITFYRSGPFGTSEYEEEAVFDLVEVDGDWLIEGAPWQFTVCSE